MKKIFLLLLLLFSLTACMTENPPQIIGTPRVHGGFIHETMAEDIIYEEIGPQPFTVLYRRENMKFEMYEPPEGVYIGAWLSPETTIRMFEHEADKRHAVYVNEINLGEEIDISWLLQCIASRATPLFIVHPPDNPGIDDIPTADLVVYMAQRLGSFNLPMFIAFFPEEHGMMPAEYTLFFRQARNIFLTHAPMAAFVWVAPSHTATSQNPFYPGDNAVDWVALPLLAEWDAENCFTDILGNFNTFYNSFHEHKPIMVLPLGVSHFTRGDYTYRLNQAAMEISRVYDALQNYPRVGLIAYADAFTLSRAYRDDFSVSIEPQLISAYSNAIYGENFLQLIEKTTNETTRWARSAYHGYIWEDRIYISTNTLENEILIMPHRQIIEINENSFVDSRRISGKIITVCPVRRVIYVDNTP